MLNAAGKLQGIRKNTGASTDPFFSDVVLLMHMEGVNGGTSFPDVKGHAVTRNGNPVTDTSWASAGLASCLVAGGPDYLTLPLTSDFVFPGDVTIEFTMRLNAFVGGNNTLMGNYVSNTAGHWMCRIQGSTTLIWYLNSAGTFTGGTGSLTVGNVYKVAMVRSGSTCSLYINGVQNGTSTTFSGNIGLSTNALSIGARSNGVEPSQVNIDELRITKRARYTGNYTPETAAFPDS